MKRNYLVYVLIGLAVGCSEQDSSTNEGQVQDGAFDAQIEAIDKAKAVEQQIQDAAAKKRRAIDN